MSSVHSDGSRETLVPGISRIVESEEREPREYVDVSIQEQDTPTYLNQFWILTQRTVQKGAKEFLSWIDVAQSLGGAAVVCILGFQSMRHYDEGRLQDRIGILFFCLIQWSYTPLYSYVFPRTCWSNRNGPQGSIILPKRTTCHC